MQIFLKDLVSLSQYIFLVYSALYVDGKEKKFILRDSLINKRLFR